MLSKTKIVIASGYFDPIHVGHVEYLEKASALGDLLYVIVNNDAQAELKKGKPFMNQEDRKTIVRALGCVDSAFISVDTDVSVCNSIEKIVNMFTDAEFIFAKGGDRHKGEIPESAICEKLNVKIVDGLGEKIRSSSEYINSAKE